MSPLASLAQEFGGVGLLLRGAFHPTSADDVPGLSGGQSAGTLAIVGNAGPGMWQAFAGSQEASCSDGALDAWTRRVVGEIAAKWQASAVFPFDGPPYFPFARWAKRAEPVYVSPIGILIHPQHGLWHAYRSALLFADRLPLPPRQQHANPCSSCAGRPCLTACPVNAFGDGRYDVPTCIAHVSRPAGKDCLDLGCRARRSCPVGRASTYPPAQAHFHMCAFAGMPSRGRKP